KDNGWGNFLAVDPTGRTSHPRVWGAGNVVDPGANVPMAIGAGTMTGAAVNFALVVEEFDRAAAAGTDWPEIATPQFWEERYASADRVWSGRVNQVLAEIAAELEPGTALDLGCGEGGDVIWLAGHGWQATGVDISATAAARATEAARDAGLADHARFLAADAATLDRSGAYDLVTASFLHSSATASRTEILRRAADWVAPGGHLLIISHAAPPPWADAHAHAHRFLPAAEEVSTLGLDGDAWAIRIAEERTRDVTSPDGEPATLEDSVILLRRAGSRSG
ncbi:MAG: methyltransferase domain-containing protein, partial [Propionibacteriaceae bacterium]|nr:methyltransferase domain-containing protein [Propionibacteriaceae bacterium]